MRRVIVICGCVLALSACGGNNVTGPSSPPPEVLSPTVSARYDPLPPERIFGYYAYSAEGAGCGWTNWILLGVGTQSVEVAKQRAEVAKACHQQVTYSPSGPWKHWPDTFRPIAQAFADAGVLHSIYVADEPFANPVGASLHVSYDDLEARIADVHTAGWKAMFTEQGGGIDKVHPPVDYYGMDWYGVKLHQVRAALQRHPEINILVPPAYMPYVGYSPLNGDGSPNQDAWIQLAREQRVGVAFWMWPSDKNWTGAEDIPEVQSQHRQFWLHW